MLHCCFVCNRQLCFSFCKNNVNKIRIECYKGLKIIIDKLERFLRMKKECFHCSCLSLVHNVKEYNGKVWMWKIHRHLYIMHQNLQTLLHRWAIIKLLCGVSSQPISMPIFHLTPLLFPRSKSAILLFWSQHILFALNDVVLAIWICDEHSSNEHKVEGLIKLSLKPYIEKNFINVHFKTPF